MSTKIHNGYKLKENSLDSLYPLLIQFGIEARKLACQLLSETIYRLAVQAYDSWTLDLEVRPPNTTAWQYASREVYHRQAIIEQQSRRDPLVDFECLVCLIPYQNTLYALLYTENAELTKLWEQQDFVIQYPYWNNEEGPKSLSDQQWKERGREWDNVLQSASGIPPAQIGLNFDVVMNNWLKTDTTYCKSDLLTKRQRAYPLAQDQAVRVMMEEKQLTPEQLANKMSLVAKAMHQCEPYVEPLCEKLQDVVTLEDLQS